MRLIVLSVLAGLCSPTLGDYSFTYTIAYKTKTTYEEKYEFVTQWGSLGTGDGQFNDPTGVAVDKMGGYIYITQIVNDRVQKFTSDGVFVTKWGGEGSGDGQFYNPRGIAVDSSGGFVYVVEQGNHRVQKFTSSGSLVGWWGLDDLAFTGWHNPDSGRIGVSGSGDGQFQQPLAIAVDNSGFVYVADSSNSRIQKFTSDGTFIAKFSANTPFFPRGIGVDKSAGHVYVTDQDINEVHKFTLRRGSFNHVDWTVITSNRDSGRLFWVRICSR